MSEQVPSEIRLMVNGREVPLNPFVRRVFESVNLALVTNLRTETEEVKTLELTLKRTPSPAN